MEQKLSALGFLTNRLGISTGALARTLHVDPSLVSKWRSGNRQLSAKSPYFEEVVDFLLAQDDAALLAALRSISPLEVPETQTPLETAALLRGLLTDRHFTAPRAYSSGSELLCTAEISLYAKGAGRREAFFALLDVAEAMQTPGELLFVDSEQSSWLLEDEAYTGKWVARLVGLLNRGFHAKIALHFSVENARFASFFRMCSPLIFHRNADWYYHRYYDENVYWFSFFILEHAMSIMGMSMGTEPTTTTVFTDAYSILQHKNVVEMVIRSCLPMFTAYAPDAGAELMQMVCPHGRPGEAVYSFLPVPAFSMMSPALMGDVLRDNGVTGAALARCRAANALLRQMLPKPGEQSRKGFIQILQLAQMKYRAENGFYSTSLSLLTGKRILVTAAQYAAGVGELLALLEECPAYSLILATEEDKLYLPQMNCWCRGMSWLVQMDGEGFRLCEEPTMVGAAAVALEQGWRRLSPIRKDRAAVTQTLLTLLSTLQ